MKKIYFRLSFFLFLSPFALFSQVPDGFVDEECPGEWAHLAGFFFDEAHNMYAWERAGKLYRIIDDQKMEPPILDISEEVAFFLDHGLLSVVLHPNFLNNGYVYLNYAVDRHYLINFGTANYDRGESITHQASIGRLTRYTLDSAQNFMQVVPDSRVVLVGDSIHNGVPLLHGSHGVGEMVFGKDGSLLVAYGDGSSFEAPDYGSHPTSYYEQALEDGIITKAENVGAFRSQILSSLNGKVLRIHPVTGEGYPSNPFFDPFNPKSTPSRVWAMGFRNPYTMSLIPGTGEHDPAQGQPGELLVGDVGSIIWEEMNRVTKGGQNFGWPVREGYDLYPRFPENISHQGALNPLNCQDFVPFRALVADSVLGQPASWPNPCDPNISLQTTVPLHRHEPPLFIYNNIKGNPGAKTYVAAFDAAGKRTGKSVDEVLANFEGDIFEGVCTIAGDFANESNFPEAYQNAYFFADYEGWIRAAWFDEQFQLNKIEAFHLNPGKITQLGFHPENGCLYYVDYKEATLNKVCFDVDPAPLVGLGFDRDYGPSPLTVSFDASTSRDPEDQPISYFWDFGDGTSSTEPVLEHTFVGDNDLPQSFPVRLTVTDTAGRSSFREILVSVNNTPPQVGFTSFEDGDLYSMNGISRLPLEAWVTDREHTGSELSYAWQVVLHHNNHTHPEPIDTQRTTYTLITPAGCDPLETFFYRISLRVTDAAGLVTEIDARLYPDCDNIEVPIPSDEVIVFPNPTSGIVALKFEEMYGNADFKLYDLQGRPVIERQWEGEGFVFQQISVVEIQAGTYYYRLKNGQKEQHGKLVIYR